MQRHDRTVRAVVLAALVLATGCRSSQPITPPPPPPSPSIPTSSPHLSKSAPTHVLWRPTRLPLRTPTATTATLEWQVARWVADERQLLFPPAPPRTWQYIVLHHSASEKDSLTTIDRFHREVRGWDGCGYHFVIGNGTYSGDGEIEVSDRWLKQKHGAHTKVAGHPEYNRYGIGICLVGHFDRHRPTAKQIEAARTLVAYLMSRYNIPPDRVALHRTLANGHTACPGRYFPEDLLLPSNW